MANQLVGDRSKNSVIKFCNKKLNLRYQKIVTISIFQKKRNYRRADLVSSGTESTSHQAFDIKIWFYSEGSRRENNTCQWSAAKQEATKIKPRIWNGKSTDQRISVYMYVYYIYTGCTCVYKESSIIKGLRKNQDALRSTYSSSRGAFSQTLRVRSQSKDPCTTNTYKRAKREPDIRQSGSIKRERERGEREGIEGGNM